MERLISSRLTPVHKLVMTPLCFGVLVLCAIVLITHDEGRWGHLVSWLLLAPGGVLIFFFCVPLKEVWIDGKQLIVSNFVKKIRIDPSNIVDVTEICWLATHPVWIHLNNRTPFGKKIMFIPTVCLSAMCNPHPIVAELKQLAGLAASEHCDDADDGPLIPHADDPVESDR